MGSRMHYASSYMIEFEGGFFNRDFESVKRLFLNEFPSFSTVVYKTWKVDREDMKKYIETLSTLPKGEVNKYFLDTDDNKYYTNELIAEIMQQVVKESDQYNEYVRLEWY